MPNQTFFNLPDEKREQILQVAINEFAENDYDSVSISRIVARAGIAKGSFYQYFADKEDLYAYLLGSLADAKTQFLSLDHPDPQHIGIFAYLRWMTEMGVAFQLTYPKLSRIWLRAINTSSLPRSFDAYMRAASLAFYQRLIEVGKEQGDISPGIDSELAAIVFDAILTSVSKYVTEHVIKAGIAVGQNNRALFDLPEVKELFNRAVDIIEHGMRKRTKEPTNQPTT